MDIILQCFATVESVGGGGWRLFAPRKTDSDFENRTLRRVLWDFVIKLSHLVAILWFQDVCHDNDCRFSAPNQFVDPHCQPRDIRND